MPRFAFTVSSRRLIFEAPILDTSVMTPYLLEILRKTYAQITLHHVLKELEISN